ncbi:MAG: hypothetical protein WCD37_10730, partial [Chloroflexia bacterium]
ITPGRAAGGGGAAVCQVETVETFYAAHSSRAIMPNGDRVKFRAICSCDTNPARVAEYAIRRGL